MKTDRELAAMLGEHVDRAHDAEHITSVHEFGIAHGSDLAHLSRRQCVRLCEMAGVNPSLGDELYDAVRKSPSTIRVDT